MTRLFMTVNSIGLALLMVITVAAIAGPAFAGDGDNVGGFKFKIYGEEDSGMQKPPGGLSGQGTLTVRGGEPSDSCGPHRSFFARSSYYSGSDLDWVACYLMTIRYLR